MLVSNVAETDYPAWTAATAYALADRAILVSTHRVYERLLAGTTATSPEADQTNWLEVGPTNKWQMFDQSNTTATSQTTALVVTITPGVVFNSLALLNVIADTVRVQIIDPIDGSVYDKTVVMQAPPTVAGWYEYFFDPIQRRSLLTFTDMPAYGSAAITVTLTMATGEASCGVLTLGQLRSIGAFGIEYGARVGVQDYSRKERDSFGNYRYVKRANSKKSMSRC